MTSARSNNGPATALRRRGTDLAILAWMIVALVPGAYLMAGHLIALPEPPGGSANVALERAIAGLRRPNERGRWLAVHVLLGTCGCSGQVLASLLARGPRPESAERVLLVEDEAAGTDIELVKKVRARGFAVESLSSQQLALRFSIESAPILIALSPDNRLLYVGGYTDRKQSPSIRDAQILDRLALGMTVKPLPIFGCAISKRLKTTLDPFGLKN